MTSPEMKETKAYKTYLGYATGVTPAKIARKFKKVSPSKKDINLNLVHVDENPKPAKKKKEKVNVNKGKGIELLSDVALTKETQLKEVLKKNQTESEAESWGMDEHDKNYDHNSSSKGSDQENDSGDDNTQSDKEKGSDSEQETDENETGSEYDQQENEEVEDNAEGDEDKGIDYTTNQFDDDVDVRLNDPVHADEGYVQKEGTDAEMINVQQGNENMEITSDQVIEDAHVTISIITKKTEVPFTSSSHSSDLASKFLNFVDIPHADAKIVSPMDVHVQHEVPSELLEHANIAKEFSQPQSTYEAIASLTEFKLKKILIDKIEKNKSLFSSYAKVYSLKKSREDKDKDEDPSTGSHQGLKKRKTRKDAEPTKGPKTKESKSGSSKGTNSQSNSSGMSVQTEELEFEIADSDMPQNQVGNLGNDDEELTREVVSKHDWFTKPKQPTNPDWNVGKTP
ncbi:hypothetical protein Tco_1474516 [Tanacetum coccineum]